jgi:hypothetical protein
MKPIVEERTNSGYSAGCNVIGNRKKDVANSKNKNTDNNENRFFKVFSNDASPPKTLILYPGMLVSPNCKMSLLINNFKQGLSPAVSFPKFR